MHACIPFIIHSFVTHPIFYYHCHHPSLCVDAVINNVSSYHNIHPLPYIHTSHYSISRSSNSTYLNPLTLRYYIMVFFFFFFQIFYYNSCYYCCCCCCCCLAFLAAGFSLINSIVLTLTQYVSSVVESYTSSQSFATASARCRKVEGSR
jgi:hypothetical protein